MGISFSEVYFNISSLFSVLRYSFSEFNELSDIMLLTKNQEAFKEDILYVGYLSNAINIDRLMNYHFLLIDDIGDFNYNNIKLKNYIILKDEDLFLVFNRAKTYFTSNMYIVNGSSLLLNSLIQDKDLKSILRTSEKILDNPIILLDIGYKLIYSSDYGEIENYWKKMIDIGYCNYEFISKLKKINIIMNSPNTNAPFTVKCDLAIYNKMVCKVLVNDKPVGYIIVFESKTQFTKEHYKLVNIISSVIAETLNKNNYYKNTNGSECEYLLLDLLENYIDSPDILEQRMQCIDFKLDKKMIIIVIDFKKYNREIKGFLRNSI